VFVSEQDKLLVKVRSHPGLKDDLGYHLEVTGELDRASGTIAVETVKRLAFEGAACARPRPALRK
jgi:hypothetical protein